eukprot:scaffold216305_cov36-Prasinocladus_malaysianus.AAC.2
MPPTRPNTSFTAVVVASDSRLRAAASLAMAEPVLQALTRAKTAPALTSDGRPVGGSEAVARYWMAREAASPAGVQPSTQSKACRLLGKRHIARANDAADVLPAGLAMFGGNSKRPASASTPPQS